MLLPSIIFPLLRCSSSVFMSKKRIRMDKMVKKKKVIICYLYNIGKLLKLSGFPFLCETENNNAFFSGLLQKLNVKLQAQCLEYEHISW